MNCIHYPTCNACYNIKLAYQDTLNIKLEAFKNICTSKDYYPDNYKDLCIIASPKPYNYRIRAQIHIKNGKIGFHRRKTNEIVEIKNCILLDAKLNEKINTLNYNKDFKGTLELYLKDNIINERLVEKKYDNYFCQVNEEVNTILKEKVIQSLNLNKTDSILELYCGAGNFTFELAKYCTICAIDIKVPDKKYRNINFIQCDINKNLDLINKFNYNKLLLDPPRKGITFNNYKLLNNFNKIVYVSCNAKSLITDAINLSKLNYTWTSSILLDMFPYTEHIESINTFIKC